MTNPARLDPHPRSVREPTPVAPPLPTEGMSVRYFYVWIPVVVVFGTLILIGPWLALIALFVGLLAVVAALGALAWAIVAALSALGRSVLGRSRKQSLAGHEIVQNAAPIGGRRTTMKIVVIGGTGLIGSKLVEKLRVAGHEAIAASPDTGVDTVTGDGLAQALEGAEVVVDVSNAPDWDDAAVMDFFQTSSRNLLAAEAAAGVKHHVALSIVGADRLAESGYFRAKVAQEETVKEGDVPYTILRATQFFEFIGRIADSSTDGDTVRLAPVFIQPESADDVAAALAEIAVNQPVNDFVELAGPDQFRLDELAERLLRAKNDPRHVTADMHARYFGAELDHYSLTPEDNVRIAPTHFEDWLSQSVAGR